MTRLAKVDTVCTESRMRSATCALESPSASASATSRSRGASTGRPVLSAAAGSARSSFERGAIQTAGKGSRFPTTGSNRMLIAWLQNSGGGIRLVRDRCG